MYRKDNLQSGIIKNFLSSEDINYIERLFRSKSDLRIQPEQMNVTMDDFNPNILDLRSVYWWPGQTTRFTLSEFINAKINNLLDIKINCDNWHILNAFRPYNIHSDSYDKFHHTATHIQEKYAYTFLIPLDDYPTNTIVFEQEAYDTKSVYDYIKEVNPEPINKIDDYTREKYLSHNEKNICQYFSIELIFPWKKGDLLYMSRHALHSSDNFVSKCFEKRALVGWSTLKEIT